MAHWRPSCIGTADTMKQATSGYGNKVNVLIIDLWAAQNVGAQGLNPETENDMKAFLSKYCSPEWKGTFDTGRVSIKYGITQVDSTVVLDDNGNIVLTHLGPSGYQQIKDALAKVVIA
jgi:hypothetical protein